MRALLLVVLISGWLSGCVSAPQPTTVDSANNQAITAHQQQLQQLLQWRLRGQMALFDLTKDDRHGLYVDWFSSPDKLTMRFSHPLRGTLARLEQTAGQALLVDNQEREYRAASATELLRDYFQLDIPIQVINAIVTGKQLPGMLETGYQIMPQQPQNLALLAYFQLAVNQQLWHAELGQYSAVSGIYLPHQIDVRTQAWRLKLQVSEWLL